MPGEKDRLAVGDRIRVTRFYGYGGYHSGDEGVVESVHQGPGGVPLYRCRMDRFWGDWFGVFEGYEIEKV